MRYVRFTSAAETFVRVRSRASEPSADPFSLRLRRRTRRPCVLGARDGAIGFAERNAAREIGELFVRAGRQGLNLVLQVLHLPRQAGHERAKFRDLFEGMRFGFLRF